MKIGKRLLAVLLAVTMAFSLFPAAIAADFPEVNTWDSDMYTDVSSKDWFYENVKAAYEFGLMIGHDDSRFAPEGHITMAQTIAVAARLHSIAAIGSENFEQGSPWYKVYADYALAQGIISAEPDNYNREATRLEFARILVKALPAEALPAINTVNYGDIPDVADDEAVYTLYRAGILRGNDDTLRFEPDSSIRRSEVAAIVTRMADPELRIEIELEQPEQPEQPGGSAIVKPVEPTPSPEPVGETASSDVTADENGKSAEEVTLEGETIKATVPAGTALEEGAEELTLSVAPMDETTGNITAGEDEEMVSYDVHIAGVAEDNTVAIIVELGAILPIGLNWGNVALYHVEDGATVAMTQVASLSELDAHNEFFYEPATGCVTVALASFSEIAVVDNTVNAWNGEFDYSWYNNAVMPLDGEAVTEYIIANADQLAALSAIVGGMDGQTQNSFSGKTVKLIADINLGDKESENNPNLIFYPIGYYNSEGTYERTNTAITSGLRNFEGIFDGNGHTISNFYQNTWEMKGDHDWYDATLQYYRDGMGLFGRVYGGTVKNLTVKNFSSDGEITTTGVIAAYADGATFENIAIFNCNPRVYNIGNGGIVGCVGWYAKEADLTTTFKNITVDNSNKISALWGSWDVACGGIVGQYYPTSGQTSAGTPKNAGIELVNCHVSAQIDVYNDVCANYQYYAYRYAGMLIGSIRENVTIDGRVYPDMTGITASGCTVNFGDWNDYYYCELVANTLASYTHDHQFSRLEQVASVDVVNKTVTSLDGEITAIPTSGRVNYVVVNGEHATENATCYHFVDGNVWNHADAGTETVNGVSGVLKEDKQHIYLEFNNLFTGYGWGVTSKGLTDFDGVTDIEVEEGKKDSVRKFEAKEYDFANIKAGDVVTVGDLFKEITDAGIDINPAAVRVSVTEITNLGIVADYNIISESDWTQNTLKFNKSNGIVKITIQDYYFCIPTSIIVEIGERTERFTIDFTNHEDYLYRVGSMNSFIAENLFSAIEGEKDNIGNVTIEVVDKNGEALNVVSAKDDWTQSSFKFETGYTGPVTVTIKDDNFSVPVVLNLEVVNAKNITKAESATSNNVVLLNDTSGTFTVSNGYTFYGNGFTVTLPTTSVQNVGNGFTGYISIGAAQDDGIANGGNLDNVRIEGPVYPEMYIYRDQAKITNSSDPDYGDGYNMRYFKNSVIVYGGNCTISNCYISGSRTALCLRGGNNVVIENTTLSGGSYANMQICAGSNVTLRDLTTIQTDVSDSYGKGKTAHGLGIAVDSGVVDIYIEGELNQYNWLCEKQWNSIVPSSYQSTFPKFFTNNTFSQYWHYLNGGTAPYVNLAFIYACNWDTGKIHDNRTTVDYGTTNATIAGVAGGVYSKVNTVGGNAITDADLSGPQYTSPGFNPVAPVLNFDNTANNDTDDANDANDTYCVYNEASGTLKIGISGDSKTLDLSSVTVTKDGNTLTHTAYLNGTQINGNSVTIKAADGAKQTLTFKATSNDAGYDKDGNPIAGTIDYTWTVTVEVATLSYPAPVWNMGGDYEFDKTNCVYAYYSTSQGYGEAVPIYEGIKINYYNKSGTLVNLDLSGTTTHPVGSNNSNSNAFTYNLTDGSVLTMKFSSGWKSGATTHQFTTYNNKVYIYPQSLDNDNYVRAKTTNQDFDVKITYTFTDPNGQSISQTMRWYNEKANNGSVTQVQWKDFDSTNGKKPSCVTPDTLVTLADGSQKRIDEVSYDDQLLVWNYFEGKYDAVPAAIIFDHGYGDNTVIKLGFSDGTEVKVVNMHQLFDAGLNKLVTIDAESVESFVGHEFVKRDGESYKTVTLVGYEVSEEYIEAYGIISALHYNILVEDMFSTDFEPDDFDLFNYFAVGEDMKFDAEAMQADIEKYGLYTYEDFEDYLSYEQFVAFNVQYFKIPVGKGLYTYEGILALIDEYLNN